MKENIIEPSEEHKQKCMDMTYVTLFSDICIIYPEDWC